MKHLLTLCIILGHTLFVISQENFLLGSGSGLLISQEGLILTNSHVVHNALDISVAVYVDGAYTSFEGRVIAEDERQDLSLLKIELAGTELPTPQYGIRPWGIKTGETIFTMGFPQPTSQGFEVKVTEGIISSTSGYMDSPTHFQISAAVQPGNSGGPLFDSNGNLIGLTNGKLTDADNVGYAIKSSTVAEFLAANSDIRPEVFESTLKGQALPNKVSALKPFVVLITTKTQGCDLSPVYNQIVRLSLNMSHEEVCTYLGTDFEEQVNNVHMRQCVWNFCNDPATKITVQFKQDRVIGLVNEVYPIRFQSESQLQLTRIKPGMAMSEVLSLAHIPPTINILSQGGFLQLTWVPENRNEKRIIMQFVEEKLHSIVKI